jgi:hypothetical protein
MHKYLKSIGFSHYQKRSDIHNLLEQLQVENRHRAIFVPMENGEKFWEIRAEVDKNIGICMSGYVDERGEFIREIYFPYGFSEEMSIHSSCTVQRHIDNEQYSGMLEDGRLGMSLIFRVSNVAKYLEKRRNNLSVQIDGVGLFAWTDKATILLPVQKTKEQINIARERSVKRTLLMNALRNDMEEVIEQLSMEEMEIYSNATRRLETEDLYSIVDNSFIPHGVECDIYLLLGEIVHIEEKRNALTMEELYDLTVECNHIFFHLGVLKQSLRGEPAVGRRIKAKIWLEGNLHFSDEN